MSSLLLACLSGALACLSFPTYSLTRLIFVALVPLLIAVSGAPVRRAFLSGWLTGIVGHVGAFAWLLNTIARFEHSSTLWALPFCAFFLAYQALQLALFALGVAWVRQRRSAISDQPALPVVFAAAWWVVLEWTFPKLIPWHFGDTLAASPLLRQGADVAGVYGLSFLIVFVNAAVSSALVSPDTPLQQRLRPVGAAAAFVAAATAYGFLQIKSFTPDTRRLGAWRPTPDTSLSIVIVQGGLHSGRDDLAAANEEAWVTYARLTEEAFAPKSAHPLTLVLSKGEMGSEVESAQRAVALPQDTDATGSFSIEDGANASREHARDLIVWPETVLRVYLQRDEGYHARVVDLVRRLDRLLFVGSLDLPAAGPGELNSGYLISPEQADRLRSQEKTPAVQIYHKRTLLPFGEYAPGATWLPFLGRWRTTGQFVVGNRGDALTLTLSEKERELHGHGLATTSSPDSRARTKTLFAPSICFEAILPGAFNHAVRDGAEFLVNITDDGWFGDSAAPYQHLDAATLRAVETRRWLVRASNSGVSAFIDPVGEIVASMPLGAIGVLRHAIGTSQAVSPYVRWGDWLVAVCFAVVSGQLARGWKNGRTPR